mgnify:CR=1 FL=1
MFTVGFHDQLFTTKKSILDHFIYISNFGSLWKKQTKPLQISALNNIIKQAGGVVGTVGSTF